VRDHSIIAPGGRVLRVREDGDPDGVPLIAHHGTPGSRLPYSHWVADATARGIRLIAYDRPGYGGSDRHEGRAGGGPHALACAALLGDRVAAAATLCGVGPYGADGLDFLAGMGEDNVIEFEAALAGPEQLAPLLEELAPQLLDASAADLVEALRSLLSPPDVAVVHDGLASELIAATGEGIRASRAGWLDDDLAFAKPWGFELGSISVPVQLWQGRQDLMVPPAHGEWLAQHIPGVDARLSDEDGHLSIEQRRIGDAHAWLLERY
jgi:pimeloyl-ACP methyl ester carboxylesterase